MKLDELTSEEHLALVGLSKLVVRADHELDAEELQVLDRLAEGIGKEAWRLAVAEAKRRFRTASDAMFYAKNVRRPAARQLIFDSMTSLAGAGELVPEEQKVIDWLAREWELEE